MNIKKYLVEGVGTFFLVLTIVTACNNGSAAGFAPLAIGAMLVALTFAGAHISGAHYNPAVTLAMFMRRKIVLNDALAYGIAQIAGALLAAVLAQTVLRGISTTHDPEPMIIDILPAFVAELLGAFVLVYVFLNVITTSANAGNSFYGLAIGLTLTACAYALGPASGGAFNPAVAIGTAVANMQDFKNILIFLVGNFGGAALATLFFNFVNEEV